MISLLLLVRGFPQVAIAEDQVPEVEVKTIEEKIITELGVEFISIARCESGIKQFNSDGSVLISRTSDVGIFQINQVHWDNAKRLGIDIDTVDGNIGFAKLLKQQNGTRDWYMSSKCHGY